MSEQVKLSSRLPGGQEAEEFNAWDGIADELIKNPTVKRIGVVIYDAPTRLVNAETNQDQPKIRILAQEDFGPLKSAPKELRELMLHAREDRLGRTPLPLEQGSVEQEIPED